MCTEITYGTGICGFRAIVDAYCDFDFRATPDRHLCGPKLSARLPVYGIGSFCLLHAQICEGTAFVCHAENYFFLKRIIGTPAAHAIFFDFQNIFNVEFLPVPPHEPMPSQNMCRNPYEGLYITCTEVRRGCKMLMRVHKPRMWLRFEDLW